MSFPFTIRKCKYSPNYQFSRNGLMLVFFTSTRIAAVREMTQLPRSPVSRYLQRQKNSYFHGITSNGDQLMTPS